MHADIPQLNEAMATACEALGICGHKVKDKTIHGPGDIEAHRGTDGRNYVDFARLLPPESPSEEYRLEPSWPPVRSWADGCVVSCSPETRKADETRARASLQAEAQHPPLLRRIRRLGTRAGHSLVNGFLDWMTEWRLTGNCGCSLTSCRANSILARWTVRAQTHRPYEVASSSWTSSCWESRQTCTRREETYATSYVVLSLLPTEAEGERRRPSQFRRPISAQSRVQSHLSQEALRRLMLVICVAPTAKNNIREQMK